MKLKQLMCFSGLFSIMLCSTAFVNPAIEINEPQKEAKRSFAEFLSHFEKTDLPFAVELDDLPKYEAMKTVNTKQLQSKKSKAPASNSPKVFQEYLPDGSLGRMSRMGPPNVLPVARFYPNDESVAVVFMTYHPFGHYQSMQFKLAVYNLKGELLPYFEQEEDYGYTEAYRLAYVSVGSTNTFKIDKEGNIWKNRYENIRKDDRKKKGIKDNEVIAYELKETTVFELKANGLIEELKEYPITDRASLD